MVSKNKEEYRKQVARIKRAMKRIESAGYQFIEDPLPDEEPARVTRKQIEELERMNTERLYYRTVAIDESTGEILATGKKLTAKERKKLATPSIDVNAPSIPVLSEDGETIHTNKGKTSKKKQAQKQAPTQPEEVVAPISLMSRTIIESFKEDAWRTAAHTDKPEVHRLVERTMNWLDQQIAKFGEDDVAQALEKAVQSGLLKRWEVYYDENENYEFIKTLTSYISEAGEEYIDDVSESYLMGVYDFADQGTDEFEITEG